MIRKHFEAEGSRIPTDIHNGYVNIGSTGTITIEAFVRLAASVLSESNTSRGHHYVSFPACNELQD